LTLSVPVQAVLDVGAVKGERNVIQVKIKRFQGKAEVVTTIASLTLGNNDMVGVFYHIALRQLGVYFSVYVYHYDHSSNECLISEQ